ncbi:MAG: CAP domain-containing protein [Lachnospiraceae bacterium]|nr:CAP domain-containing protein [Lachnospiraceae bacterium]
MKNMKKVAAVVTLASMLALVAGCGAKAPALDEASASRAFVEGVIPDESVPLAATPGDPALLAAANEALDLVNEERAAGNLAPLSWSNGLAGAAYVRASELPKLFSHTRPDGSAWYTVNETIMYGENLAEFYDTPEAVVQAWMNSPTHRANIMEADFATCGISIYKDGGDYYWAQEFGY